MLVCTQINICYLQDHRRKDDQLTFSYEDIYEVIDDNNNLYRNMIMNMMKMNQDYASQYIILD